MKAGREIVALFLMLFAPALSFAGSDRISTRLVPDNSEPASFEMASETAYMVGIIGNPNSYEIGAQFITARWRLGRVFPDGFFRGYHQFYATAMAEPIFRGPENRYFGISLGMRYNFFHPESRFMPYVSGGVGLGWIDSHADIYGAQGQDFTFNILSALGLAYRINQHWNASLGMVYQHLSNGGQTDPNPSLNLLGPQIGVTCSF